MSVAIIEIKVKKFKSQVFEKENNNDNKASTWCNKYAVDWTKASKQNIRTKQKITENNTCFETQLFLPQPRVPQIPRFCVQLSSGITGLWGMVRNVKCWCNSGKKMDSSNSGGTIKCLRYSMELQYIKE